MRLSRIYGKRAKQHHLLAETLDIMLHKLMLTSRQLVGLGQ